MRDNLRQAGTICIAAIAAGILLPDTAVSEPWSAPLERGGQVEVDPRTNRPVLNQDGRKTQLWDGIHRLDDGSVIRIQGGRVIPTTEMLQKTPDASDSTVPESQATEETAPPSIEPSAGASACEQLVLNACGPTRRCWSTPACDAALQLRDLEQEDRLRSADPESLEEMSKPCGDAATNPFFKRCE